MKFKCCAVLQLSETLGAGVKAWRNQCFGSLMVNEMVEWGLRVLGFWKDPVEVITFFWIDDPWFVVSLLYT